jgi:sterol desaturase/sphingolipid hydroxylase (fatty acid hydroxylase superfamily)
MAETIELIGLALLPLFLMLGLVWSHRSFKAPRFWRLRALLVTVFSFALSTGVALSWGSVLGEGSLLDASVLGTVGGALLGILVYELVHYWYHRLAHEHDLLWRWAHQMHHSAESVDAFGAYYLHPLDTFFFTSWSTLVFFPFLGLSPTSGAIAGAFLMFNAMFQHANVRTPRWLGYIVQRPESHCVHHARDVHRHNYSDLPLWDMAFGTFENPRTFEGEAGFYDGASSRLFDMLVGRDVTEPTPSYEVASTPAVQPAVGLQR